MDISTADLMDDRGDDLDSCELQFRRFGGRTAFHGPVTTVRCMEDNVVLRGVLARPGEGGVLVVDGGGSLRTALLGDIVARSAVDNGWAGIIINGAVRDVGILRTLDIGILALGSNPRRSGKGGAGAVDETVTLGSATFKPGAEVFSDEDGVVVTKGAASGARTSD